MTKAKIGRILQKYEGTITGLQDLAGGKDPSGLFYILANHLSYLLDTNPEAVISAKGIEMRRKLHFIINALGRHLLANSQVIENRNFLRDPHQTNVLADSGIIIPEEPVIWVSNHAFKDDGLATILAAKRHAYLFFGGLPQFYNTLDGIATWLNGLVMVNRKVTVSRRTSIAKAVRAMQFSADLIIFPEGGWNKSPNALLTDLWPGIYRIACETGAKLVPVVHYIRDCSNQEKNNPIHTVIDEPIRIDDLSERAALEYLRDVLATWFYLMMEVYGKTTRENLLKGTASSVEVWEQQLVDRVKTVARYDTEIELCADYRPKWKVLPQDVWRSVADISELTENNVLHVLYARRLIEQLNTEDFQRRF